MTITYKQGDEVSLNEAIALKGTYLKAIEMTTATIKANVEKILNDLHFDVCYSPDAMAEWNSAFTNGALDVEVIPEA